MDDDSFRIAELALQGLSCSHILVKMALEAQGRDSSDLVRAMSGLAVGMGEGYNCGCLTGGCCVIGLCAGRTHNEREHPLFELMLSEFTRWFHSEMNERYEGIDCTAIMKFDPALRVQRCPPLIVETWMKLKEILAKHDVDISGAPEDAS